MIPHSARGLVVVAALLAACGSPPPAPAARAETDTLNTATRREVVERVIAIMDAQYVFPSKATEVSTHLRARMSAGAYDGLTDATFFAGTLTRDLQSVTRDHHLRVSVPAVEALIPVNAARADAPLGIGRVELTPDSIGYIEIIAFAGMNDATMGAVRDAMNRVAAARALIIDLRRNGGGGAEMVAHVASYLFGEERVQMSSIYWRTLDDTIHFHTDPRVRGAKFGLTKPVYVLIGAGTFSAAEAFVYDLKARNRITVVGEKTGGGAHPGGSHSLPGGLRVFVPAGRAINPVTRTSWEGTGVTPDVAVPADSALAVALRMLAK
jgi:hypothetical protein